MAFIVGKKTIKRRIDFEAEGDLGETVPASFVIVVERPDKPASKEFSKLYAKFADVLAKGSKAGESDQVSVESFIESVDVAESALSDLVRSKISGWDEVAGEDGQPLAFSTEHLDIVFNDKEARRAIFEDYQALVSGRKKDAEKNSETPADAGTT